MSAATIKHGTMQLILQQEDEISSLRDSSFGSIELIDFKESLLRVGTSVNSEYLLFDDEGYREYTGDPNAVRPIKTDPGAAPNFTNLTTLGEVEAAKANFEADKEAYYTEQGAIEGLKRLIASNVHENVLETLKSTTHGFSNVTILEMLEAITDAADEEEAFDVADKLNSYNEMPDLHDGTSLKNFFVKKEILKKQLETATTNPVPTHGALQVNMLAHLKKEPDFSKAVKEWEDKPAAERTWDEFVTFFTAADKRRSKINKYTSGSTTAGNSPFGANNVEDIIERKVAAGIAQVAVAVDGTIAQGIEQALAAKAGSSTIAKTTSSKDKQKIEELEKKVKELEDKAAKAKERRAKQVKMTDKCPHCNRMHKYIAAERCYGHPDFSGTVPAGWKPAEL